MSGAAFRQTHHMVALAAVLDELFDPSKIHFTRERERERESRLVSAAVMGDPKLQGGHFVSRVAESDERRWPIISQLQMKAKASLGAISVIILRLFPLPPSNSGQSSDVIFSTST